jgi:hypothetical protein
MRLWEYNRNNKPTRAELEQIAAFLRSEISGFLGQDITVFREHVTDGDACNSWIAGTIGEPSPFQLQWEAIVLYTVAEHGPWIGAELLLFSHGKRLGCQYMQGTSYLRFKFDRTGESSGKWRVVGWEMDAPEYWEHITTPRESEYGELRRTYNPPS